MPLLITIQKSGVKIDPDTPIIPKEQSACPLYTAIPIEIRTMIWCYLLTIPEPIEKAHKHLGSKDTALLDNYSPIPHIDSAVLSTCRVIYSEALPILYGQNTFEFSSANAIRSFQNKSLVGYPLGMSIIFRESGNWIPDSLNANSLTAFNLKLAPMGRLTMLRSIILTLNAEYRWHNPIGVNGVRAAPNRDHIWRDWSTTLFSESDDLCPWGGRSGFPALERLTIDFSEWQLAESEGLLVRQIFARVCAERD